MWKLVFSLSLLFFTSALLAQKSSPLGIWKTIDDENELKVKGKHWTGLSRTQTWYRVKS